VANFHRNTASGSVMTSTGVNMTFRSLRDDLASVRAAAPAGVVDTAVTSIGQSEQGQDIHAIRIGRNPAKPVLIAGCHHAREWISVEVPFLFAEYVVGRYSADAHVRRLVDDRDIWIVPMINPDGHEHSVTTDRGWRKNKTAPGSGREEVDPNRNYVTAQWGLVTGHMSDDPTSLLYRGRAPGYAAEVRAMQALITTRRFLGTLDFHSYGRYVLFPWAGRVEAHPDPFLDRMAANLERVIDAKGTNYTRMAGSALYPSLGAPPADGLVPGGMMDFVVENLPDSVAITVELEPEHGNGNGWTFELPESEIEPTFLLHRGAILSFLNCIGSVRNPLASQRLVLEPGSSNDLVVHRTDCSATFEGY
jgi:carboxypeptidase T